MSEEYFKINTKIIDNFGEKLPAPTIQTYVGLSRFADKRGLVTDEKTQEQWSEAIGIGRTTFQRSTKILKEEGLLEIITPRNPTHCKCYIIKDPGESKPSNKRRIFVDYKNGKTNDI